MELSAIDPSSVELEGATAILGVLEGLVPLTGSEDLYDSEVPGGLEEAGFKGKSGQVIVVPGNTARSVLLVGLGAELSFEALRDASGNAVRKVRTERAVTFLPLAGVDESTRAVAEGAILGSYQYRTYKTEDGDQPVHCERLELAGADEPSMKRAVLIAEKTNLARDWVNTPAMDLSPKAYAEAIMAAAEAVGVAAEVWDPERIDDERMGALLGVAAGSRREPRVVTLTYSPVDGPVEVALVGKGITFDSGGLSLKSRVNMEDMKDDMAGSAAVVAATIAIAEMGLPVNVSCITPLTDNAVGGDATRPGDVLRPVDGPTIEVTNTDAEGRLILADGIGLARRLDPQVIIDVATLTGAARVALGNKIGAVFSADPELASSLLDAASRAGEMFWELPLYRDYRKMLDSDIADMKNSPGVPYGSAIAAAVFLSEYAGDARWAHLDIAGPARSRETAGDQVKGGSGFAVRTLVEYVIGLAASGNVKT